MEMDLGLGPWGTRLARRALGLGRAETLYETLRARDSEVENPANAAAFCAGALKEMGVVWEFPEDRLREWKTVTGPVMVVSNHPFGAIDALLMITLMGQLRNDFRFVVNAILKVIEELRPVFMPFEIMGNRGTPGENVIPLRHLVQYLKGGGMVGMFPAGEVAAYPSWGARKIEELPWNPHLGRLVQMSGATVLPLFFEGENTRLFQYLGLLAPKVRVALLVREMLARKGRVELTLGAPIAFREGDGRLEAGELTKHFREICLKNSKSSGEFQNL